MRELICMSMPVVKSQCWVRGATQHLLPTLNGLYSKEIVADALFNHGIENEVCK